MSFFTIQVLQEKLSRLTLSQDSIETLSLWIIHHKAHANSSVDVWMEDMQKANADRRLMLFYLANDVLQNSRRRGADVFQDLFRDPLRQAVTLVRGQKIQTSVERMFRIWKERRVYDNVFLKELEQLIEPARKSETPVPAAPMFKLCLMEDALTELRKFEAELKVKSSYLTNLRVDISDPTTSLSQLKDKAEGGRVSSEFDEASQKLQDYSECLGIEVNERINILDMLKDCQDYLNHCLTQVQKTSSDYKQLGKKVKDLKSKLDVRRKEIERAQCTATSDPVAKEDITDVGDMEIESDNEGQDSLPNPAPLAPQLAQIAQTVPPIGVTKTPPITPPTFPQTPTMPGPLRSQVSDASFPVQPPPRLQPPVNAVSAPSVPVSTLGGGGFPNLSVPPSSRPPSSSQSYAPPLPPHATPPQTPQPPPPSNTPLRANFPTGSGVPPRSNFPAMSSNFPPGSTIPPGSNVPRGSSVPIRSNVPPGSNIPIGANVLPGSNISHVPLRSHVPPGSNISPGSNIPPGSTVPPRSNVPLGSNVPPGSNVLLRSNVPPGSNIPPRPSISPGSNVPLRFQRPLFSPSTSVHPPSPSNVSAVGSRPSFSGPPVRPIFPPPQPGNLVNVRQPPPPQGIGQGGGQRGGLYNNTNGPRPQLPPQPSQANTFPTTVPPPQLTTPIRTNSPGGPPPPTYSNAALVMTSHPTPPKHLALESSKDSVGGDSVDLLARSQTGLDQRLKNMVAKKMLGDMFDDYGSSSSSSEGDEKPYSPTSDEPEMSISNTGTPKPDEDIDTDSVPTPDSKNMTPDDGGSPHINMNNPILQALYSSSPDTNKKGEMSVSVSETTTLSLEPDPMMSDPVANIDTEYLQGILDAVKSTSGVQKEEAVDPGTNLSSSFEAPVPIPPAPKQPGLASLKDIKITPTVTNLLGELFPQLSKTLQQNKKRKQEDAEEDSTAQKVPRLVEGHNAAPQVVANMAEQAYSEQNIPPLPPAPVMQGPRPNLGPPHPGVGPPRPDFRQPHPDLGPPQPVPGPIPRAMPRGMPPPSRGQFHPESVRSGPPGTFPPRFRGPPPPQGPPSMVRHQGPPPLQLGGRPYPPPPPPPAPPGSSMVPNHTGLVPSGPYPPHTPNQFKQMPMSGQQQSLGEGAMADSGGFYQTAPPMIPRPPYPGADLFRPPRYV